MMDSRLLLDSCVLSCVLRDMACTHNRLGWPCGVNLDQLAAEVTLDEIVNRRTCRIREGSKSEECNDNCCAGAHRFIVQTSPWTRNVRTPCCFCRGQRCEANRALTPSVYAAPLRSSPSLSLTSRSGQGNRARLEHPGGHGGGACGASADGRERRLGDARSLSRRTRRSIATQPASSPGVGAVRSFPECAETVCPPHSSARAEPTVSALPPLRELPRRSRPTTRRTPEGGGRALDPVRSRS